MKKFFVATFVLILTTYSAFAISEFGYGIKLKMDEGNTFVQSVIPNSLAEKAGITNGQKVIKINGKDTNKINQDNLSNIDTFAKLKLTTSDNKIFNLQKEDITLLKAYNNVNSTFNNTSKYKVRDYKTEHIVLADAFDAHKHVKYMNAYFNYADIISVNNSKSFVDLFKITEENIKAAIKLAETTKRDYYNIYNSIFINNQNYDIYGQAFKQFLEIAIYCDVNSALIERQIKEFNNSQKQQFAQIVYNTRIAANLYHYATTELSLYTIKHPCNMNNVDNWNSQLNTQNEMYNKNYQKLCKLLSENKITFNKPGPMSNRAQTSIASVPKEKWVTDKQMILLAEELGYNPKNCTAYKKIVDDRIAAQKNQQKANGGTTQQAAKSTASKPKNTYVDDSIAKNTLVYYAMCANKGTYCSNYMSYYNQAIQYYKPLINTSSHAKELYCQLRMTNLDLKMRAGAGDPIGEIQQLKMECGD